VFNDNVAGENCIRIVKRSWGMMKEDALNVVGPMMRT
jgi:hypothetical protein